MRKRTRARELALQALYQLDMRGPEVLDDIASLLDDETVEPDVRLFARTLVDGVWASREKLDETIAKVAENWDIHRMAVIDRNVLRLATYELTCLDDVPPKVSINEAIDLAKRFSTADSGGFVNGILDRIRSQSDDPEPEAEES